MKLQVRHAGGELTVGTQKEFLLLWQRGVIAADDLVRREGQELWVPAGELPYQAGAPSYLPNAVVYDGRRKRVLLVLGEPRPEVWGWDGKTWEKLSA